MTSAIVAAILTWLTTNVIIPLIRLGGDKLHLNKVEKEAAKAAESLKNATSKEDIDNSIDNIP